MKTLTLAATLLCTVAAQAQKLPCKVQDINKALEQYDKKVLPTSQYLLMDVDCDGVKDIVFRDSNSPSACYAVLLCKGRSLKVENFGYDGYDMLGVAPGGFSFYQHDDHMGPSGRTWNTEVTRYKNGKAVLSGGEIMMVTYQNGEPVEEVDYTLNGKTASARAYKKAVPDKITWFSSINNGWRMVMNNQKADTATSEQYDILTGAIGGYPITMCLNKGDKIGGYYYYESRPESRFTLHCTSQEALDNGDRNVAIEETTADGKHTGTFNGKLGGNNSSFDGTFTNYKGETFDFQLHYTLR